MVEMSVGGISVDAEAGAAVLLLEGDNGETLAIAIGIAEATSIAKELEGVSFPRPLTHDLMVQMLEGLGARLEAVEITDLREDTYFAELILADSRGRTLRLDTRPSDGIALAVRVESPIRVRRKLVEQPESEAQEIPSPTDKETWMRLLREMDPEDFGKYKM